MEKLTEEEKSFLALAIYNLRRHEQQRPLWKTFALEASLAKKLDIREHLWGLLNPQGRSNG